MTSLKAARTLGVLLLAGLVVAVPGVQSSARSRKAPEVQAPPPPPPPPANPVGLPDRLIADAAGYEAYLLRATATSPGFTSGESVAQALKTAAAYEPRALIRGAVAYGAIAALQDPGFVAAVRAAGNSPDNRRLMVGYILSDPTYAFNFKGSDAAAGLAKQALGAAGLRLYVAGKAVKQSAYDVQHQSWSRDEIADRKGRLASVVAAADNGLAPAQERIPSLQRAASGAEPLGITAQPASPPYTPLVARALQLAAIAAIGEASDAAYDQLTTLLAEPGADTCLHMAKLNLYQCLAVAKPHYEDIFCMGQHVMADTGACLARSAGLDLPPDPAPPPPVIKAAASAKSRRHRPA